MLEGAILDAVQELRPSRALVEAKRMSLQAEVRPVETDQEQYIALAAAAGQIDALARKLRDTEQQRARLLHELSALDNLAQLSQFDVRRIEGDLRRRVSEWREMLHRQKPVAASRLAIR